MISIGFGLTTVTTAPMRRSPNTHDHGLRKSGAQRIDRHDDRHTDGHLHGRMRGCRPGAATNRAPATVCSPSRRTQPAVEAQ